MVYGRAMSLPRFRANAYTECTRSYGIQSQTYAKICLCFKAANKPKSPDSGSVKLPKSGKGRYVNGYTYPNSRQNLILEGDRAKRRRLRNGLLIMFPNKIRSTRS